MLARLNPLPALRAYVTKQILQAEERLRSDLLGCEDRTRAGVAEVKGYVESAVDESEARILKAIRREFEALRESAAPIPAGATVHLSPGVPRGRFVPSAAAELDPPYPAQQSGGLPPGRPHP